MRHLILACACAAVAATGADAQSPAQTPQIAASAEFEVASIKRNTSDRPTMMGGPPPSPARGQIALTWIPARFLATRAYPDLTAPIVVDGLPPWADSEHYDVTVKFRPGATLAEQAVMWKRLLSERMKLAAHYETRTRRAYNLVVARADRRLGPDLKPSTLDCPPPEPGVRPELPPPELMAAIRPGATITPDIEQRLMSRCRSTFTAGNTSYGGALPIDGLIMSLGLGGRLDGPVVNKTGLEGLYSFKLTFHRSLNPPGPDDPPSLFTALQDQLGLKLEPTMTEGRILVVDHIERPTEN
jgi:uncharacterized protein (TIGR03435 family)